MKNEVRQSSSEFTVVDLTDLTSAKRNPISFAINVILPRRKLSLLGGHGGVGKTSLALIFAAHKAVGADWCGLACPLGKAAFVSLEDSGEEIRFALASICRVFKLDTALVAANLKVIDGSGFESELFGMIGSGDNRRADRTAAFDQLEKLVAGSELIVIDNASDGFSGNENDRPQVRRFLRELTKMAVKNDAAVLLLVHIDKAAAKNGSRNNSYSGSSSWHNSARSRLALIDDKDGLEFRQEKNQRGPLLAPMPARFDEFGVLHVDAANPRKAAVQFDSFEDAVHACLLRANAKGERVPAGRGVGNGSAFSAMRHMRGFPSALKRNSEFLKVLDRLEDERSVESREYVESKQRKTRLELIAAPVRQCASAVLHTTRALAHHDAPNASMVVTRTTGAIGAIGASLDTSRSHSAPALRQCSSDEDHRRTKN